MGSDIGPSAKPAIKVSDEWHQEVSLVASAFHPDFRPLSTRDNVTCRKWRQAVLLFYAALALTITALAAAADRAGPELQKTGSVVNLAASDVHDPR